MVELLFRIFHIVNKCAGARTTIHFWAIRKDFNIKWYLPYYQSLSWGEQCQKQAGTPFIFYQRRRRSSFIGVRRNEESALGKMKIQFCWILQRSFGYARIGWCAAAGHSMSCCFLLSTRNASLFDFLTLNNFLFFFTIACNFKWY